MSKKENPALKYRSMISAMAKVRWNVEAGRHRRPDGAVDVRSLMKRFHEYTLADERVDYHKQIQVISDFVGLSVEELHYFSDVGEWIEVERTTCEMGDDEYEKHWENEYAHPSMDNLNRMKWLSMSPDAREEIALLNEMYYGSGC